MDPIDNAAAAGAPAETEQQPADSVADGLVTCEPVCAACGRQGVTAEAVPAESGDGCGMLFEGHSVPMWVYDPKTLRFLAVNRAAIVQYGFTEQEFLGMKITAIRPEEEIPSLLEAVAKPAAGTEKPEIRIHRRRNGEVFDAEVVGFQLRFQGVQAVMVAANDVTERRLTAELLRHSEMKYRVLFECSSDAYWLADERSILDCNPAGLEMFGYAPEEAMPHPAALSPPYQPDGSSSGPAAQERMASAFRNGAERFEWVHQRRNGETFPAEVGLTALTLSGRPLMLGTVRDITERKRAEESLLFKTALLEAQSETAIDGILVFDDTGRLIATNRQFRELFRVPQEVLDAGNGQQMRDHLAEMMEDRDGFLERIDYFVSHPEEKCRDEFRLKGGKTVDRYSGPLIDSTGRYRGRISYYRDVSDRKAAEERNLFLAYYDALTGLPRRTLMQQRLDQALDAARRKNERVAVLFLDLDRFKVHNVSLGHEFGDLLLKSAAERLKSCARDGRDTVARLDGDEFIIVLSGIKGLDAASGAAKRVIKTLAQDFTIEGRSVNVGCSLGISMFPEDGDDGGTLIKNAGAAMYIAKEGGRNNFRVFTEDMHTRALERSTIESDLRRALERKEFFLVYQPQMEIESGRITGMEALLRWQHPELGLVSPASFIPVAENSGLILPIGEWVLWTACVQARRWLSDGLLLGPVAVNVSAVQFRQAGFAGLIRKVLRDTGLPPEYLELELTEGVLLSNADVTFPVLRELKEMGLKLAIDDFGTGYSSLSYLRQFPVSKLKIDSSFVRELEAKPDDGVIIVAIIGMAKSLKLKVIAEGVEEAAQIAFLQEHGCDEIQGYYFSRPITAAEITEKLSNLRVPGKVVAMPARVAG